MQRFILSDFGANLVTRKLGKEVSRQINFLGSEKIILDFKNIRIINSSFADELIGKNVKELGFTNFKEKVQIENATTNIKIVIKKAMMDRLLG